jgi:hypothetical protein
LKTLRINKEETYIFRFYTNRSTQRPEGKYHILMHEDGKASRLNFWRQQSTEKAQRLEPEDLPDQLSHPCSSIQHHAFWFANRSLATRTNLPPKAPYPLFKMSGPVRSFLSTRLYISNANKHIQVVPVNPRPMLQSL